MFLNAGWEIEYYHGQSHFHKADLRFTAVYRHHCYFARFGGADLKPWIITLQGFVRFWYKIFKLLVECTRPDLKTWHYFCGWVYTEQQGFPNVCIMKTMMHREGATKEKALPPTVTFDDSGSNSEPALWHFSGLKVRYKHIFNVRRPAIVKGFKGQKKIFKLNPKPYWKPVQGSEHWGHAFLSLVPVHNLALAFF